MRPEPRQRPTTSRPHPMSRFRRMSIVHAAMIGGDAAMLVALADSLFLSIDPSAARSQVLLFLIVSFAPFVLLAPLIGPAIDRMAGGRRLVIQIVAIIRIVVSLMIAFTIDSLALFPLIFAALVFQRAYTVSKQAIVPSVVRNDSELVEANSKLGVIAGITGFIAVIPAGALQLITGSTTPTLMYSAAIFGYGLLAATRLPPEKVVSSEPQAVETRQLQQVSLKYAAGAMTALRCAVGFVFFHLAFWFREADVDNTARGTVLFGAAVSLSALGTMGGNLLSPHLRKAVTEEMMLKIALVLVGVGGIAMSIVGGFVAGIVVAVLVNFAAAVGRLGFEAIVQREAPAANHGQVFAAYETRFQLGWAVAGLIPIILVIPGSAGLLVVGIGVGLALANYITAVRGIGEPVRAELRDRFTSLVARLPLPRQVTPSAVRARRDADPGRAAERDTGGPAATARRRQRRAGKHQPLDPPPPGAPRRSPGPELPPPAPGEHRPRPPR